MPARWSWAGWCSCGRRCTAVSWTSTPPALVRANAPDDTVTLDLVCRIRYWPLPCGLWHDAQLSATVGPTPLVTPPLPQTVPLPQPALRIPPVPPWVEVTAAPAARGWTWPMLRTFVPLRYETRAPFAESIRAVVKPPPRRAPSTAPVALLGSYCTPWRTSVVALVPLWQSRQSSGRSLLSRPSAVAVWARWQPAHVSAVSPPVPLLTAIW